MFIDEVIKQAFPIYEADGEYNNQAAVKKLGDELDRIYNRKGKWSIEGIELTMGEVAQLYDIHKNIVKDHVELDRIETVSKSVSDVLKRLGFHVEPSGTGWKLAESKLTEAYRYSFKDVPAWAKDVVRDEFGEKQGYLDLYDGGNFLDLTYKEGGDVLTYRVRPDGTITMR